MNTTTQANKEISPELSAYVKHIGGLVVISEDRNDREVADELMRAIIEAGQINDSHHVSKDSALHYAALSPYPHHVAALLEAGADKQAINVLGETPLHMAVKWKRLGSIGILLDAGFDLEQASARGTTPMGVAMELEDKDPLGFIQSYKAREAIKKVMCYGFHVTPK